MLPFIALAMLAVLPFVLLSAFVEINSLPFSAYEKGANARASSIFFETGEIPEHVTSIGRDMKINTGGIDPFPRLQNIEENRQWSKAMIEQAMVNTCLVIYFRCGKKDINLLWSFMPNKNGSVSQILSAPSSINLDCETATDVEYGKYGRHLFKGAIGDETLSENFGGTATNYHYSRPATGTGCSFYDLVDLR